MKTLRKLTVLFLTVFLMLSLCLPAAAYSDEYWDGYWETYNRGYNDGAADYADGKDPAVSLEYTYEDGRRDGYNEGYQCGYEDAQWTDVEVPGYDDDWMTDAEIAARGGLPGTVNVMLDGICIDFSDTRPERKNNRVMVPVRAILEALGADVDYTASSRVVTAKLGEMKLTHAVGSDLVRVTGDGWVRETTMDCVSYVSQGRTMVPVRFISEALGYYVDWDSTYQTVVIVDLQRLKDNYDSHLTTLNLILADAMQQQTPGKNYRESLNMTMDLTLFDTLNGNQRFGASASVSGVSNEKAANYQIEADLTDVISYLKTLYGDELDSGSMMMMNLLRRLEAEVILNKQTGELYLSSPVLNLMAGQAAWFAAELGDSIPVAEREYTATDLVVLMEQNDWTSPFWLYETVDGDLESLVQVLGDQNFVRSGKTATLKLGMEELAQMQGMPLEDLFYYGPSEFALELKVTQTGTAACDYTLSLNMTDDSGRIGMSLKKQGGSVSGSLALHLKNEMELKLDVSASRRETSELVQKLQPPEDALILDLDEL